MHPIRIILIGLLLSIGQLSLSSQSFRCDGSLFFSTNSGAGLTTLNEVTLVPFGVSFGQVKQYPGGNFNALGFNPEDNFIYAVKANSNEIVRLKADNSFEVIGEVPILDQLTSTAGDCTPEGFYLCHDQMLDQILVFDVVDNFALVNQIDLFWNPLSENSGSFTARIDDFAIDPTNTTVAYSFQGSYFDTDLEPQNTQGYLLQINLDFQSPDLGMVTPIARIPTDEIRRVGSLFFNSGGGLFAYGSTSREASSTQSQLLTIDKFSGAVSKFAIAGPGGVFTDGCSCPYNLSFTNFADPNFALCTDSKLTYTLTIANQSFQDILNATLTDTLAEGMVIANISGNFSGTIAAGTGVGTRILQLDNLQVSARSRAFINLEVEIIDLPIDLIPNQAFLTELPEGLGFNLPSDDPATNFVGDATDIFSDPQRLESFTIDLTHPTDCLKPEDGQLILRAPVLIPGIEYEVNMRNEEFEEFAYTVLIDAQNGFVIDSLLPGEYSLYRISPNTSNCSFAMKDTAVIINAPNELIRADVFTNSPICAGADLEISATVFPPEGEVMWNGPNGFESAALELNFDSARAIQSGLYEMVFSHGVCEQIREIDVFVAPDIAANINSQTAYCERDSVHLIAEGAGVLQDFIWTTPAGMQLNDSILEISTASFEDEGIYELIIDNGFCRDTTSKFISISPTPNLSLPQAVRSHFCDPLVLEPELSTSANITYTWEPAEGLSCADCPNPAIEIPTNIKYQLTVSNEFTCQDSANIFVLIEEENLIYIPNIFSPNFDGNNDFFQVFPNCSVASIDNFQIFDRFGNMVYYLASAQDFSSPRIFWDGTFKGVAANIGTYLWQMELTLIDGTSRTLTGDVALFRGE